MKTMSAIAMIAVFVASSATASAQGFSFPDFSSVSGLALNGSAVQFGNQLRLTNTVANQTAGAWHLTPQPVVAGFDTQFTFTITPGPVLAEGMAFVIQNAPAGAGTLGGAVWGLGYGPGSNGAAIVNSIAIEIDTFQDGFLNDTSSNELSVHTRGTLANNENESFSIGRTTPPFSLSNGAPHTMRVQYVPGTLRVYIDNLTTPLLTIPWNILTGGSFVSGAAVGGLNVPNATAFVGFTASTGAGTLNERVEIGSWTWTSTPGVPACYVGNVGMSAGGPFDVLRINGSAGGFFRRVGVSTFDPFTINIAQPPTTTVPVPFIIFGTAGVSSASNPLVLPIGTLCFPVALPNQPVDTFTLANSFPGAVASIFPSPLTPVSLAIPGVPFAASATLQGVISEDPSNPFALAVTNAVVLDVVPGPTPTITSVAPLSGTPGTTITVTGSGFSAAAGLFVGGQQVVPATVSSTAVTFPYPAVLACGSSVQVVNPDGQSATAPLNPNPTVTNTVNPQGSAAGGASFIIIGSGFAPGTTVTIGGAPATIGNQTATVLVTTTPPGTAGAATVVITTPGGCTVNSTYTYL